MRPPDQPHVGSPNAFSFNVASVRGQGAITIERGAGRTERRSFSVTGGMCPRCEGMGTVTDIDLTQLFEDSKSLAEGALTIPGYTTGGWNYRLCAASGFVDPDKPIRTRFEASVLDYKLGGRDISEVLAMPVTEARTFSAPARHARRPRT